MNKYLLSIEVKDGEVEQVLKELHDAQEVISKCYCKLRDMGVLTIKKEESASGN